MEEQSETLSSKKEFAFASSTILSQVGRGIIVGLVVGLIVGSFRFLIEKGFHLIQGLYQDQAHLVRNLFYRWSILFNSLLAQCEINSVRKRYQGFRNSSSRSRTERAHDPKLVGAYFGKNIF